MPPRLPLSGVRFHLAASIPEDATETQRDGISEFVQKLVSEVLREGGSVIHGSHPTIVAALEKGSAVFREAGGSRDAVTLVRARKYTRGPEHLAEIEQHRTFAAVQTIPSDPTNPSESLVPMREWMASRSDVVVAVGGKWWDASKSRAGIPEELEESLTRGHPGFVVAGFGGACRGYVDENPEALSRLRNGWSKTENEELARNTDSADLARRIVRQAKLLPLARQDIVRSRAFRILCLDGGGLRGTFTAAVMARWASLMPGAGGTDLIKHFDLVAGTSTGAILAVGLGLGKTPENILEFFRRDGPAIFSSPRLRGSKYDAAKLKNALRGAYGGRLLRESVCRLVIPSIRADHGKAHVITTPHHPHRHADAHCLAVDAALASGSAPAYFDPATIEDEIAAQRYLDGGIWANNPVLPAIAEAVGVLGQPLDRIEILSIGTLESEADLTAAQGGGQITWAMRMVDLFFASQESAAAMLANQLIGKHRHLRINQQTPAEIPLDNAKAIEQMATRGDEVGRDTFAEVQSRFLDGFHADSWG